MSRIEKPVRRSRLMPDIPKTLSPILMIDECSELTAVLPLRVVSPNMARRDSHWSKRSKRSKNERQGTMYALMAVLGDGRRAGMPRPPLRVLLTRLGPGTLDSDNLPGAFKAARDGVADFLGIDDRHDHLVSYEYAQEKQKQYGVRIEIFRRAT
jgi:hypothetical protein